MTSSEILENTTVAYWNVSKVWNGKADEVVSTGDAIFICSNIANSMRPEFSLRLRAQNLLDEIIAGGSIYMGECYDNVLPLAKPIKKARRRSK